MIKINQLNSGGIRCFDGPPRSHITISNAMHYYGIKLVRLLIPCCASCLILHSSFFRLNWQCVRMLFSALYCTRAYSVCTQKDPFLVNEKPLSMMEVTIARIHIWNSPLLCTYESQKDIKQPKISFPPDKIARSKWKWLSILQQCI